MKELRTWQSMSNSGMAALLALALLLAATSAAGQTYTPLFTFQ